MFLRAQRPARTFVSIRGILFVFLRPTNIHEYASTFNALEKSRILSPCNGSPRINFARWASGF